MADAACNSALTAADVYEQLFVPAEFQEWAPRLIEAARVVAGQRVLDVACGTGVLAREAARVVGPSGYVAGVDLDRGMLSVAARVAPAIDWRQASAELLPFADASFDAVVSQFGLMFFPDRHAALLAMRRVLVPGGRMAVAVWDTLENTPAYARLVDLLARFAGSDAADALREPFALGDRDELQPLFADIGVRDLQVRTHVGSASFPSVRAMVEAEVRGWLPTIGIDVSAPQLDRIVAEAGDALAEFVQADGAVRFASPAHIVTATKP